MKKVSKNIIGITGSKGALGTLFIKKYNNKFKFRIYKDRIENKKKFNKWLKKNLDIEYFIHLAAISSISRSKKNQKKTYNINSTATIEIIKILNKARLKKFKYFLFSSSSHVYKPSFKSLSEQSIRKPLTVYGKSKKKVEDFILKNNKKIKFKIGIARIFNFYSKKHRNGFFIQDMKQKMRLKKSALKITKINISRDYIDAYQVCEILFFMMKKKVQKALNIGSGKEINLIDLIKLIKKKHNLNNQLIFETKKYPGLFANINLLRKLGYKKKLKKFKLI